MSFTCRGPLYMFSDVIICIICMGPLGESSHHSEGPEISGGSILEFSICPNVHI